VIREPLYSPQVETVLNTLEAGSDVRLLNAVCDAIDLICDHGDTAAARREQLFTKIGNPVWKVAVRDSNHEWSVLWLPHGEVATIYYIGEI
jgi:hypothetical protein